ncbi:hypothetical protein DIPPA_56690 [Diplonema papillatum]|nr:hypothetical protein DIPPA_56690 [Diplonema papillatum]
MLTAVIGRLRTSPFNGTHPCRRLREVLVDRSTFAWSPTDPVERMSETTVANPAQVRRSASATCGSGRVEIALDFLVPPSLVDAELQIIAADSSHFSPKTLADIRGASALPSVKNCDMPELHPLTEPIHLPPLKAT